jgi:hypothetical protein
LEPDRILTKMNTGNTFSSKLTYAGWIFNFVTIIFLLAVQGRLPPEVPLFYGLPQGREQLAKPIFLILPSLISIVIITANLFMIRFLKDDFLKKVILAAGAGTALFACITSVKIAFLVGNI